MKLKRTKFALGSSLLATAAFLTTPLLAQQNINWGSAAGNPPDVTSSNVALTTAFTAELGTFGAFDPASTTDINLWAANWTSFQETSFDGLFQNFSQAMTIQPAGSLVADHTAFHNNDAWIWAFTGSADPAASNPEAALFRDTDWTFPDGSFNITSVDFNPAGIDTPQVLLGGVDSGSISPTFASHPDSSFTTQGTDGNFEIQTAAIPEPSSTILTLLGAFGLAFRRRRS